jgi:hypothetical protein
MTGEAFTAVAVSMLAIPRKPTIMLTPNRYRETPCSLSLIEHSSTPALIRHILPLVSFIDIPMASGCIFNSIDPLCA